jgi:hypothetical protein
MLAVMYLVGIHMSASIISTVIQISAGIVVYLVLLIISKDEYIKKIKDKIISGVRKYVDKKKD